MIDLATRKPANKSAALVIARNNEPIRYKPAHKDDKRITTRLNFPLLEKVPLSSAGTQKDHTGKKYGKLTVLGVYANSEPKKRKWVVKCECGNQELRNTRKVKDASETSMCKECERLRRVRRKSFFLTHGFDKEDLK